ncbi:hypothetical protein PENTCL1PPCAC_14940, partial [Pristionchus entomophagus]
VVTILSSLLLSILGCRREYNEKRNTFQDVCDQFYMTDNHTNYSNSEVFVLNVLIYLVYVVCILNACVYVGIVVTL